MHIADFLSKTFTDKGEEQKQQRDASTSQADDINILEIEESTRSCSRIYESY